MQIEAPEKQSRVVGFIDLGTNSIRLLLVRIFPNRSYTVLSQRKETIRLGEGEYRSENLRPEAMDRAVLVCQKFVAMARSQGAEEIIAHATSATREAQNKKLFLRRLEDEAGIDVHVISGKEEARLTYLGVSSGFNMGERQGLFLDIGGGSTEIIVGDQTEYFYLDTLKLGAIRLSMLFMDQAEGPISSKRYERIRNYVRDTAIRTLQKANRHRLEICIGSSGTIENLADITIRQFQQRRRQPGDVVTYPQLKQVIETLCALPLTDRKKVPGINPDRADIIIGGCAILDTMMDELGLSEIHISERSMRDGMLVDYLSRMNVDEITEDVTFREASVLRLGRVLGFDEDHARHVAGLSLNLFDSTRDAGLHDLTLRERELLEYAALLHDVGVSLSYSNHHAHSYYFITNADLLGFDQTEIAIIAATALFHRKRSPRRKKDQEFSALDTRSQEIVEILGALLSIAEGLDRSHMGLVSSVQVDAFGKRKALLHVHAKEECPLEVWGLEYHDKAFRKVFGRQLQVEMVVENTEDDLAPPS
jgi:exopolyphosphatase/guanosine-5'-triphosphate,3'-diphosphate pyrophosphatase